MRGWMPGCPVSALLVLLLACCSLNGGSGSWTVRENAKEGSRNWWQPQTALAPSIEGFSTSFSVYPGQAAKFKISCDATSANYSLEIYRLGYYGGLGGRLLATVEIPSAACSQQPACRWTAATRMTDCGNWRGSVEWKVPADAPTGVYLALPADREASVFGGYIPFVVMQPLHATGADILFKTSDLTWVAYNKYGGWNVYGGNHSKDFATRAFAASYNRPFANRLAYPIGQQQNFVLGSEFPMLYWLEKFGYDVAYCGCADVETLSDAGLLTAYKVWLSVGHDEYWTLEMKTAFLSARERGVHLAFLSGNEIFWRVVWEETYLSKLADTALSASSSSSETRRAFYCRKESIENISAPHAELWTGTFADPRHQRYPDPENALTGQRFLVNSYRNDSMTASVEDLELRFWRNTSHLLSSGLQKAAGYRSPPGVLGYEWDVFVDDAFRPPGLFSLSSTTARIVHQLCENFGASYRGSGVAQHRLVMYRHYRSLSSSFSSTVADQLSNSSPSSSAINSSCSSLLALPWRNAFPPLASSAAGLVFGAGTIQWAWALSSFRDGDAMPEDSVLQQATLNLLADMSALPAHSLRTSRGTLLVPTESSKVGNRNAIVELVYPSTSEDVSPPRSHILTPFRIEYVKSHHPGSMKSPSASPSRHAVLRIRGTAMDVGGGRVAAVEVSVDGGKTWHVAHGRSKWKFDFHFHKPHSSSSASSFLEGGGRGFAFHDPGDKYDGRLHNVTSVAYRLREALVHERGLLLQPGLERKTRAGKKKSSSTAEEKEAESGREHVLVVMSRAVDDSGNLEPVPVEAVLCKLWRRDTSLLTDVENVVIYHLEGSG